MKGGQLDLLRILFLTLATAVLAPLPLLAAADRLEQDNVVNGG